MEVIRNVGKWGNSAGVLLPREWLGSRVKIEIVEDGKDIKKEILGITVGEKNICICLANLPIF